ncbi:MAG: hypothetical protein LBL49_09095 [Clostridiales Family XIII bacterium]|jgi:hypothetical protein|nr:hypothetical protein [Clostridiales Family XIII bacterium]
MKVLIVFLGLLTLFSSTVFYQSDMGRYTRGLVFMKTLAEECAAGAALYFDEEAYADGRLVFNKGEGTEYIEYILADTKLPYELKTGEKPSYEVLFYDDDSGYGQMIYGFGAVHSPSVLVKLSVHIDDVFRLPFLSVTSIERQAMYELPEP